ncbi:MAG: 4Fe-4S dicluster domain-containing protein [Pseudomonadota bacterium]
MSQRREIFVRLDRCVGCHTCELSCAVEHSASKVLFGAIGERPTPKRRIYVEWVPPEHKLPILCRHCEDAPCLHACISGAINRTVDGVVLTDIDRCIGCWTCVMVCPYGVIGRHGELQKAYRCDRCPDRERPACVDSCPTKALVYRTVEDFSAEVRQAASRELLAGEGG